jgi:hypothetical protein
MDAIDTGSSGLTRSTVTGLDITLGIARRRRYDSRLSFGQSKGDRMTVTIEYCVV